jgi:hypothetical protein
MELCDVATPEQLVEYYKENGLQDTNEKINHLSEVMKVKAVQCEYGSADEKVLTCLEGCALVGSWKGYR